MVSDVLQIEPQAQSIRVFKIFLSHQDAMPAWFSDVEYVQITQRHVKPSVTDAIIMATYRRDQKPEYQLQNGQS